MGVAIKLNRKYDKDYINCHANGLGCKRNEQKSILCFFNSIKADKEDDDNIDSDDDWNDWESEVENVMDDDDIITVDENEVEINGEGNANIEIISLAITNKTGRKRKPCLGLCSDLIAKYVDRIPACYGRARRVEVIAKEINTVRAKKCTGYSDFEKTIYHECYTLKYDSILAHCLTIPKPALKNLKFTPKFYFENNSLKKYLQNQDLSDKANKGAFKEKSVFTELCEVIVQAAVHKDNNKGNFSTRALNLFRQNLEGRTIQNIRKLRANNKDTLTNPNLSFENLKPALCYNPVLGCIVRSTLSVEQTKINAYEDIQPIINDIKIKKAIAKDVRAYILQILLPNFPPVVIALIANNGTDNMLMITSFHQELLTQIALQLNLLILSIGSDNAIVEFKAQVAIQSYSINEQLIFKNNKLVVDFSCPIFPKVGPVIHV
ncbi:hypothetical protein GLOIN_2v1776655 [Rhizophagus irregularis DAOM 181602=DAOM 197198]|nr:hypothetical protein GLOIN_2v1776655 [Rhizophagus irregularis DAOM 181602=DAOM 197198]